MIELLVVVSIIAILAGLLLPAVNLVRASAESSNCVSNQRQISVAIGSYTTDNDGFLPAGYRSSTSINLYVSYDTLLAPYEGREIVNRFSVPTNPDPKSLKAWNMYRCPSEKKALIDPQWQAQNGTNFYRTYAMNGATVSSVLKGLYDSADWVVNEQSISFHLSQIAKPSNTIQVCEIRYLQARMGGSLGEAVANPLNQITASSGYYFATEPLHRTKWNYLFADGHTATLLPTETNSPGIAQNTTDAKGMWWR